jgi:hypothetical protein
MSNNRQKEFNTLNAGSVPLKKKNKDKYRDLDEKVWL